MDNPTSLLDEDKRINIEPLPEEKKEEKRKPRRPKLSPSKRKNAKKTDDKYTLTESSTKALEKLERLKE